MASEPSVARYPRSPSDGVSMTAMSINLPPPSWMARIATALGISPRSALAIRLGGPGRGDRPRVDGPGADRRSARVLLQRVGDPAHRAGDREDRLPRPGDHARDAGEGRQREVDVRLGERAPARLADHRLRHGEPP